MNEPQIPGFDIIEKLGSGGMATVWKARQISLDRVVAVKVLSSQQVVDPADIQRFQTESRAAAKLKHPGIVQVYDANAEGDLYYFVMEYVDGYTVGDWMERRGVLPEKDALLVAECVADALDYAWDREGIIHCDIKPDNVIIDSDGTVKIADLGLARTIRSMNVEEDSDEVMGTPAYISPEQSAGTAELDCRTDIYALGAMLYHLVTGHILFEGNSDVEIMDLQITETVSDAMDVNSDVSQSLCWLIEKMLAKDMTARHGDWTAVRADIDRVKNHRSPLGDPIAEGLSTMRRSTRRTRLVRGPAPVSALPPPGVGAGGKLALVGVVFGVLAGLALLTVRQLGLIDLGPFDPAPVANSTTAVPDPDPETEVRAMYQAARQWMSENPQAYDETIRRFQSVVTHSPTSDYARLAGEDISALQSARLARTQQVLDRLARESESLAKQGKLLEAAAFYENYAGELAEVIYDERLIFAAGLRAKHARATEETRRREEAVRRAEGLYAEVAELVADGRTGVAVAAVNAACNDAELVQWHAELEALARLLERLLSVDTRVMESFLLQSGTEITVYLKTGSERLRVIDVRDGRLIASRRLSAGSGGARRDVSLGLTDMSPRERLMRMGSSDSPPSALCKGILALRSRAYSHARRYFGMIGADLSDRFLVLVELSEKALADDEAREALARLLGGLGIAVDGDVRGWLETVEGSPIPEERHEQALRAVEGYRDRYGEGSFAARAEPILDLILRKVGAGRDTAAEPGQTPEPDGKPDSEPAQPAELEALVDALAAVNAGLIGKDIVTRPGPDGAIREVRIISPGLSDISALAELKNLRILVCGGAGPNRDKRKPIVKLSDLSPLRGMELEYVYLGTTSVEDLSPLQGQPIRELLLRDTPVSDLSAVKDMPLQKLDVRRTKIDDFSPLRGMKLTVLHAEGVGVVDFRALSAMPLEELDLSSTQFRDTGLLAGMPLSSLDLTHTRAHRFAVLRNLPLTTLRLGYTQIRDISVLKGKPLERLNLAGTNVKDISVLAGMPLKGLSLSGTRVTDFSVLEGMPLEGLDLSRTRISALRVIEGAPLKDLNISYTDVSDLSPLAGSSLVTLWMSGTTVRDLGPVREMSLQTLVCENVSASLVPLRGTTIASLWVSAPDEVSESILKDLPKLRWLNGKPWPRGG